MVKEYRVCSMRFNLRGILNEEGEEFVAPSIKEIEGNSLDQVEISKVFHCDGLLLCVTRDNSRLVVWNPYLGQTRWIEPRGSFHRLDKYAIGYDKNKNHKILRVLDDCEDSVDEEILEAIVEFEIYDFQSNSWRVLDVTPGWDIEFYQRGASLRGNTYFFAKEKLVMEVGESPELEDILLCFDFTRESFGEFLPLPFPHYVEDIGTLFSVKQDKLAALYQHFDTFEMEVWVTTKIEPDAVSWSKILAVDMRPLTGFQFEVTAGSFFIDEEKKVAVVFDVDKSETYATACIIGEDGFFKELNLGEAHVDLEEAPYGHPLVCSSSMFQV